jgi:PDZ domain-containing protein
VSRRFLTLFLAAALALGLALAGAWATVPYVVLQPGPAFDTLGTVGTTPVLSVKGHRTYPTDGTLDLTTVSVLDHVTLFEALSGWLSSSDAVVPRELVYPPDQSDQQTEQQNQQAMQQSQDDAVAAALHQLGVPGRTVVTVAGVAKGKPAAGLLQVGDVLTTVDGQQVADVAGLRALLSDRPVGATAVVGYTRKGVAGTVTVGTVASSDDPRRAVIGIEAAERTTFPVTVDVMLKDVGGPSAGLMFALGILDKLEPGSLTGGRRIAGTGEITPDGKVGEIGGIAQKMRGARAAGATVFLSPAGNCREAARSKPSGLQLVKVSTLKGALAALATLRAGGTPPTC